MNIYDPIAEALGLEPLFNDEPLEDLLEQHPPIISKEQLSEFNRVTANKRVEQGTHHWLGGDMQRRNTIKRTELGLNPFSGEAGSLFSKRINAERLANGTHNFAIPELHKKCIDTQIKNGTHPFLQPEIQQQNGIKGAAASKEKRVARFNGDTNPNNTLKQCQHCLKTVTAPVYGRYHGDKCTSAK